MLAKRQLSQFITVVVVDVVVKVMVLHIIESAASNSDPSGCIMCKFENIKNRRDNQTTTKEPKRPREKLTNNKKTQKKTTTKTKRLDLCRPNNIT